MGPLPVSTHGFRYILVITDLFSKWVEAFPLVGTDSNTLAKILVDEIVCQYGMPEIIHSDQGSNFVSEVIRTLCAMMGVQRTQTTPYHPQGNGQVERFNRTLEGMLSKVVSDHQRDWDEHLQKVLFAYRTAIHKSTGYSPFLVTFGRSPNLPVDVVLGRPSTSTGDVPQFVQKTQTVLHSAFLQVRQHLQQAHQRQKQVADSSSVREAFPVGDRVWLYVPRVKQGQSKKFTSLWRGPYTVISKTSPINYRIQLIGGNQKTTVHRNRLKLCHTDPTLPLVQKRANDTQSTSSINRRNDGGYVILDEEGGEINRIGGQEDETIGDEVPENDELPGNMNPTEHEVNDDQRRYPQRARQQPNLYQAGFS